MLPCLHMKQTLKEASAVGVPCGIWDTRDITAAGRYVREGMCCGVLTTS